MFNKKFLIVALIFLPWSLIAQFSISGKVVSADADEALSGAHVRLMPTTYKQVADAGGQFSFNNLSAGNYQLITSFLGFEDEVKFVTLKRDTVLEVVMKPASFLQDEVVVSASRPRPKTPLTYSIIDAKEIGKNNSGADLPYLLQQTPSLVVSSDAGTGIGYTSLRIRGTDLTRINVTINGVPVNDPESHGVFFVNLPDFAASVDNIHIQRGVGTSANGAAAFGASLNIKTDAPSDKAFARYESNVGSFNTYRNSLNFSTGRSKQGFALNGRLSRITSDGYVDRGWSDLKSYYLSASWSNAQTLIKIIATSGKEATYQAWNGVPKDSLKTASGRRYNPSGEMFNSEKKLIGYYKNQTDNYQQDYYQLHLAHQFNNQFQLSGAAFLTKGRGYYESWKNQRKFSEYALPNVVIGLDTIRRTDLIQQKWLDNSFYGFNLALQHQKGRFSSTLGAGWNHYDGDHFGYISWAQYASESLNDKPWYTNKGLKTDYNVYLKSLFTMNEALNAFIDLQYRHIDYKISGIHDDLRDISQEHTFDFFNPKAGLFYTINKRNQAYVSIAVSHREPNRSVYRDADPGQKITHEQLVNLEAGYSFKSQKLRVNSNVYFMDYNDQLVLTGKINNVGAAIMTNVPESYRLGIENSIDYSFSRMISVGGHLSLSANKILNYTHFVDNWSYWDDPENEPYQYAYELGTTDISFSPAVVGGFTLGVRPFDGMAIDLTGSYVSRQYLDNTSNKDRSLDPYLVTNANIRYEVSQSLFRRLEIKLQLNNLTSTWYETNGWIYQYVYEQEEYTMDGYFPQALLHAVFGIAVEF
ncbi:MAG: TonB-dependent receptor [Bacteroidetes bacterium]|nr:TonB-dependent receptor [Bacteroidota bacterium]MBU1579241.1 TonB-dependent receptor [Bacteroidota bacterium]MBU2557310.1 TonB-dependent receptor [Bacteroidota bacterium]